MDFERARLVQERWFSAVRLLLLEAMFLQVRPEADLPRMVEARFGLLFMVFGGYTLLIAFLSLTRHRWPAPWSYATAAIDVILAVAVAATWSDTILSPGLVGVATAAITVGARRFHVFDTFIYALLIQLGMIAAHYVVYGRLPLDQFDLLVITSIALLAVMSRAITLAPSPEDLDRPLKQLGEGSTKAVGELPPENESTAERVFPPVAAALSEFSDSELAGVLVHDSEDHADLYTMANGQLSKEQLPAPTEEQLAGRLLAIQEPTILTRRDNLTTRGLPDQYPPRLDSLIVAPLRAIASHGAVLFAANRKGGPYTVADRIVASLLSAEAARLKLAHDFAVESSQALLAASDALLAAAEAKRPGSKVQAQESARFAVAIARELGWDDRKLEDIALAALLHDIGELAIPDVLLDKAEALSPEEFEIVKQHPRITAKIIDPLNRSKLVLDSVFAHHERWDGRGYPSGLTGEDIPEGARVLSLAHAIDAMLSPKPYRAPMGPTEALQEVILGSGTQFDPSTVQAFLAVLRREGETFLQRREGAAAPSATDWNPYRGD